LENERVSARQGPGAATASLPISVRAITKGYGAFTALDAVDLDIASGEFITVLGPSGSGKTTLLMVLAGFIRPDSGTLMFGDRDVSLVPPHKRNVGMVFQNYALFPHMSVAGNVAYPLKLRAVPKGDIAQRVQEALDLVQLSALGERRIDQLSGGQRQRVALARAIVFEPRILLMDEPLSALDKKLREEMQIEVRHLHQRLGMTTVYVTHDQREALTMSDRIAVIDGGRFRQIGTPHDIYERPESRFIAEFIGESQFLPVDVRNGAAWHGSRQIVLERLLTSVHGPHLLVVRPEKLSILRSADAGCGLNILEGTVKEVVYQGESSLVYVTLVGGSDLGVRRPARSADGTPLDPGAPIRLGLAPADAVIVPAEAEQ
jgi:putative spermidine/putrescine transport system ATP-binding protein